MPCRPAISSMSLGTAWEHALFDKLQEASLAGFRGIEIFYEDLEYLATTYEGGSKGEHAGKPTSDELRKAASETAAWCKDLNLTIIALQPFMYAEGLKDRGEHNAKIEELQFWCGLCHILGTDMILLPSTFYPADQVSRKPDTIESDLREAASLAGQQSPPIRIAFEGLAWGTHINTWEQVYSMVEKINLDKFGMCIDTFNLCGKIWADPEVESGIVANADDILARSVQRLAEVVDVKKIFFVQLIDAERLKSPLVEGHPWYRPNQPARMSWSRNARRFAYEDGYLPVQKVAKVLFEDLKFNGWVSMELFSRHLLEKDESVPKTHAERGYKSWIKLVEEFGLEGKKQRPGFSRFQSSFGGALDF